MEKPTIKQRIDSFLTFLWNPKEKTFMGRGARSWAEITFFYIIFFSCLAGFFAATMAGFYTTIDEKFPKLQGDSSLLRGNPGMGYGPMPDIDTTLVYLRKPLKDREAYVNSLNEILKEYNKTLNNVNCTNVTEPRINENVACRVDFQALTQKCNEANAYGILEGKPCILLKLNKIFNWIPKVWDKQEEPDDIPEAVKDRYVPDKIWIECHGENPADNDNLGLDDIEYFPQQGFPLAFYPYVNQKDYRSPLVFVKFNKVTHHLALMIECKALAKNIEVDRSEKEGGVHFEMLIDP